MQRRKATVIIGRKAMSYLGESVLIKRSRVLKNGLIEGIKDT